MRAIRARYDPYLQTRNRVEQLENLGHSVDKVEFIVMGGTFMSLPADYRDYFIRSLHDALSGHVSNNVDEAVYYGERSRVKCVGITIETRPDYCLKPHLKYASAAARRPFACSASPLRAPLSEVHFAVPSRTAVRGTRAADAPRVP